MAREAFYYNALALHYGGSYAQLSRAREYFGEWRTAWEHTPSSLDPEKAWEDLVRADAQCILRDDPAFPVLLKEIPFPPWGIYVRGDLGVLRLQAVAVVGTRRASPAGTSAAHAFSKRFAGAGFLVVSGLAFGIDAAAHEGALERGATAAVLASGVDRFTPRTHRHLGERIKRQGILISEYPLGMEPIPHRFLERNRIISGLSRGTLLIEAPFRSGSLATARFAQEQNREVWVLPGRAEDPNFQGSHQLIRAGAELVTTPEEVLMSLGFEPSPSAAIRKGSLDPNEEIILSLLARTGMLDIDKISEHTNLNIQKVSQAVTMLLVKGLVKESGEGYVRA